MNRKQDYNFDRFGSRQNPLWSLTIEKANFWCFPIQLARNRDFQLIARNFRKQNFNQMKLFLLPVSLSQQKKIEELDDE